jgi:phosphatidylglycerol:prolipoprotein diacylglycerol transferase
MPTEIPTPGFWVHHLDPVAIHFPQSWGLQGIYWYGLAYASAFILGGWLMARWRRQGLAPLRSAEDDSALLTAVIAGVVFGGRIGHVVLYAGGEFLSDPAMIFRVWQGGMSFHGGIVGSGLGVAWFARTRRRSYYEVGDLICACAPAGLLFGRLANFINAELIGRPTNLPWAIVFPLPGGLYSPPSHPSQLYEATLEGLLPMLWMWIRYPRRLPPGRLGGEFLMLYAGARILCETVRLPEDGYIIGMTAGQFWCLPMAAYGLWLVLRTRGQPAQPLRT